MRKFSAFLLFFTLILGFCGCAKTPATSPSPTASLMPSDNALGGVDYGESVSLRVWGPQEEQSLLSEMIDEFKAAHPNTKWDISLGVVSEGDAATRYLEDPQAAADVFMCENGQIRQLVNAGALYEVAGIYADFVREQNVAGAVEAVTLADRLYAFPMTADNGYFLYYDKSVISDVSTLDGILEQADAAGKKVLIDLSNGYYLASFFLGAGCRLWFDENGNQQLDFDSDDGIAAAEAAKALAAHPVFQTGDDSVIVGGIGSTIAAAVSGTWNLAAIEEALGENFGAAKLPTFTLGGEQAQMASFGGYKVVCVNSLTRSPDASMALAQWLTSEDAQLERFERRSLGPSNKNAAESDAVLANAALAAYAEQSEFAVSQNGVGESFWVPAEAFGLALETGESSMSLEEQLRAMVAQIKGK